MKNLLSLLLLASSYMYSMDRTPHQTLVPNEKSLVREERIHEKMELGNKYRIDKQTYLNCIVALSEQNDSSQVGPMLGHVDDDYRVLAAMSFFGYFDVTKNNIYRTN